MKKTSVLMVGLKASVVDFDKWPQLSVEKLESAFKGVKNELEQQGYAAHWCLTDTGETAVAQLEGDLEQFQPDVVLVGAGVRTDPDHFLLFETMINTIHSKAPQARIAFNTIPHDSVEAVQRWV